LTGAGAPLAIASIDLIHNTAQVPKPAASFGHVSRSTTKLANDGKHEILCDYNSTYFTVPPALTCHCRLRHTTLSDWVRILATAQT